MSIDMESGLPSIRIVQTLIKEEREVELKVVTDDLIVGKILWQDPSCLCLVDHYNQQTIITRHSIVFMKPKT